MSHDDFISTRRNFLRAALIGGAAAGMGLAASCATAQQSAVCELTDDNIEGPFYRRGAPVRSGTIADQVRGRALVLTGTVRSCDRALGGAELDFWQADPLGAYDHTGWTLRGKIRARADGTYRLVTVVPGHYLNGDAYRPAHIHVKVRTPRRPELTTQLYFEGDPYNASDPWFLPTLMLHPRTDGDVKHARFDFAV